jgi:GNAT superfamily N-acetyltransferase
MGPWRYPSVSDDPGKGGANEMNPIVRVLAPEDWPLLRTLRIRALTDSAKAFGESLENVQSRAEDQWIKDFQDVYWFALFLGVDPVGLAELNPPDGALGDSHMHIESMWVESKQRRRGLGTYLVSEIERYAREELLQTHLNLWVFDHNSQAEAFYRALGYLGPVRTKEFSLAERVEIENEYGKEIVYES